MRGQAGILAKGGKVTTMMTSYQPQCHRIVVEVRTVAEDAEVGKDEEPSQKDSREHWDVQEGTESRTTVG